MPRLVIEVFGIVQGVGFRPFVYRLARRLGLTGIVRNDSSGVYIEVQGDEQGTSLFFELLRTQPPPLARITSIQKKQINEITESGFRIIPSKASSDRHTLISPDIATCPDCLSELLDPTDRRFEYPFINCTNCGPRYTIISDIPYDRPFTTMAAFKMCETCLSEYENPDDRRFHAQPNACPVCGPQVSYINSRGEEISELAFDQVAQDLRDGHIIAVKGLGGYHLAVNAENHESVVELRRRKHRFEKPLALMGASLDVLKKIAQIDSYDAELLQSQHRPIVICPRRHTDLVSPQVSPDNDWLGLMLPYTPLHEILFRHTGLPYLVMTSANISEEPICYTNSECTDRMKSIADGYLHHNRPINLRCDDSVVRSFAGNTHFIRRSRGYAPRPVILHKPGPSVLAVGAHLKNTICLTRDRYAFMSQHIGDLENTLTMDVFEQTAQHLQRINEIKPVAIIHDLHPDYLCTRWAVGQPNVPKFAVQHHYAHILSVMAEHGLEEPVIGVALDGTGYGSDGKIWGGEILICDIHSFKRVAHLKNIPLPGGDKAVAQPWRMAMSYLSEAGVNTEEAMDRLFPALKNEFKILKQMIDKKINSPDTSSCGRLFDAVAAILGLRQAVAYEGQAAVLLESSAVKAGQNDLPDIGSFDIINDNECLEIRAEQLIRNIYRGILAQKPIPGLSLAFHLALIDVLEKTICHLRETEKIHKVALSGGCFQNMILLSGLHQRLVKDGFEVLVNLEVPANDGGIALGQAWWGLNNSETGK